MTTARRTGIVAVLVSAIVVAGCAAGPTATAPTAAGTSAPVPSSSTGSTTGSSTGSSTAGTATVPGSAPGSTSRPSGTAPTGTSGLVEAACAKTLRHTVAGTVTAPELNEVSGLAASTSNPGVLWVHNDSGDSARAFALSSTGALLGTYTITGASAQDWEDMAIGPGARPSDPAPFLYLADIGDNAEKRTSVTVYRVAEPKVDPAATAGTVALPGAEALTFTYPDGPHNAETLLVDTDGSLYILTKQADATTIFRAPPGLAAGSTTTLTDVGTVDLEEAALLTAGAISATGDAVVLRTYRQVHLYARAPGSTIAATLAGKSCQGEAADEPQGEAITFSADGRSYLTTSEGVDQPINAFRAP